MDTKYHPKRHDPIDFEARAFVRERYTSQLVACVEEVYYGDNKAWVERLPWRQRWAYKLMQAWKNFRKKGH